jgi:hypothetical protein
MARCPPPSTPPRDGDRVTPRPPPPGDSVPVGGSADDDSTAAQNACATSGWAMSLCAPDAPPPLQMIALDSRL